MLRRKIGVSNLSVLFYIKWQNRTWQCDMIFTFSWCWWGYCLSLKILAVEPGQEDSFSLHCQPSSEYASLRLLSKDTLQHLPCHTFLFTIGSEKILMVNWSISIISRRILWSTEDCILHAPQTQTNTFIYEHTQTHT